MIDIRIRMQLQYRNRSCDIPETDNFVVFKCEIILIMQLLIVIIKKPFKCNVVCLLIIK